MSSVTPPSPRSTSWRRSVTAPLLSISLSPLLHREEADCYHEHEQAQLLVCLVEGVDEGLEPREVAHQLEDPHDVHHTDQAHDLPRLAHDFKVLQWREIQSELGESVTTTLGS